MSRGFQDPSFAGMRVLEVWANQDENRRFEITWGGPRHYVGKNQKVTGGYKVVVWTGDNVKVRHAIYGRTLLEAAEEATRLVDD